MRRLLLLLALPLALLGCDSDDPDDPVDLARTFTVTLENVDEADPVLKSDAFAVPAGASAAGPIGPGGAYEVTFTAGPNLVPGVGTRLSFVTMFIQSNDLFYAFEPEGIALYDADGNALGASGPVDITDQVGLYDAGTEVNEEPGVGPNQAPRQSGPDTGDEENGVVGPVDDAFTYPAVEDVIRVTVESEPDAAAGAYAFTLRLENVSDASTLPIPGGSVAVPLSPGAWAVHSDGITFYELGAEASDGLEDIAEDGMPGVMADALADLRGLIIPLSPGAYVVHTDAVEFFESGTAAGAGIEGIAEDGAPDALVAALSGVDGVVSVAAFNTPVGAGGPAPIGPGGSYRLTFDAEPGDRLSLATMFIQSNDLFYTFAGEGLALFDAAGAPVTGDVTGSIRLYDAGTEVDEEPGVGLDQAPRQSGPDTGEEENGVLTRVNGTDDGFSYPADADVIRVSISVE